MTVPLNGQCVSKGNNKNMDQYQFRWVAYFILNLADGRLCEEYLRINGRQLPWEATEQMLANSKRGAL